MPMLSCADTPLLSEASQAFQSLFFIYQPAFDTESGNYFAAKSVQGRWETICGLLLEQTQRNILSSSKTIRLVLLSLIFFSPSLLCKHCLYDFASYHLQTESAFVEAVSITRVFLLIYSVIWLIGKEDRLSFGSAICDILTLGNIRGGRQQREQFSKA